MPKILLIEDDQNLAREIKNFLEAKQLSVDSAGSLARAEDFLAVSQFDLIVLDFNLPDGHGPNLIKSLRERGILTPILMLTERAQITDKICGFEAGTDDYLTKPFDPTEFLLRIRALLR